MSFEFWGFTQAAFLSPPAGLFGYIFVILYASVGLLALIRNLGSLGRLKARQWLALFVLLAAGVLAAQLFILRFPAQILPPPGIPLESRRPGLALFVLLPAFLAGGWLGVLPAMLVGFATGLSRAGWETFSWFTPFEYMFVAGAVAWLVRQDYRGWPLAVVRHPAAAGLAVGLLAWPLLFLSYLFYSPTIGLPGWDYVSSLTNAAYPVFAAEAGLAGLLAEFARVGLPAWWGTPRRLRPPFYSSSLNSKLFFGLIPIGIFGIAVLLWATIHLATDVATGLMVDQMAGVADTAGRGIPFFIQTGQNLVASLASQRELLVAAHQTQVTTLSTALAQWQTDLDHLQEIAGQPTLDYDGRVLRITRIYDKADLRVVGWAKRVVDGQLRWLRWQSDALRTRPELQTAWAQAQRWGQNPGEAERQNETSIAAIDDWQIFYFRNDTWTNPQSSSGAGADAATPASAAPLPDGVRLVLGLSAGQPVSGNITRDWVRPIIGGGK